MDSHRSVIIQSIQKTANATADPNQLWTFVTSRSGIIASNAIKQIIDLVKSEVVPWSQALDGFLNVLSTVSGVTLDDVIIGITDILSFHAEREIDSTLDYNCPFSVKAAHGGKTHPYITIISTNPDETCTILFSQLQRIFGSIGSTSQRNSKYLQNVMMMMNPFFDFVLLDGESTQNSWFLRLLNFIVNLTYRNVNDEFFQIFRERVLDYLLSVTQKIMQTSDSNISSKYTIISNSIYPILQSLVDILQAPFVRNSLSSSFLREFSINLSIQILSVSTDAHHSNLSTISYVSLLSNLLELHQDFPDVISKPSFVILWPSLSFLLLDAQSCEVQTKTLEIMKKLTENREDAINERDISPALINIAVLPIFQAISELQGTSRANVMDILFAVRRFSMIQKVINESSRDKISALLESQNISGTIIDILSETRLLLENFSEESNLENSFLKSNSYLTKLFHVPYFFHHDVKTRIHALNRVISVIGENSESHKFPIFLIFLYILRNDDSSSIHIHILYRSLPSLVSANDFAISSKILKISMSLIEGEDGFRETKLCAVGIRMLHKLCIRYKGCWKSLRFVLAEWVKKRKLVTISKFDKMYTAGEGFEVELAALATMRCELLRDMCRSNGKDYAEELLPFISSLLQSVILHPKSLCLIIESLTACVEAEVANARAVWSVLLVHVAKAITRREDFNAQLISRLCDFYKSIAQSDESTDVYSEFKKEILSSYICPLVFPRRFDATEEEGQNVLFQIQRDRRILRLGLQTISYFPAVDILSWILLESPEALLSQIFHEDAEGGSDLCQIEEWQYVFGKIISHEISSMRRSLFTVKVTSDTSDSQSIHESTFQKIKKRTKSISNKIVDDFENGMVNPGLQAGYALASLSCYQRNSDLVSQDLKHTSFYKSMVNAIQDISLSDHWLIRLGIVTEWCSFFETGLQELLPTRDGEATVKMLLEDLTKRLVEAKVPLTFQNVILSLTGYCLALRSLEVSSSQEHAGNTLRQILRIYSIDESLENQRQQVSSLLAHDEVQFAVIISMGYLSTLVMMDHKLVQQVIDTLVSKLTQGNQAGVSEWIPFGAGYSLGTLLSHLASAQMETTEIRIMRSQTLDFLDEFLTHIFSDDTSRSNVTMSSIDTNLGIMIGLSKFNREVEEKVESIYQRAISDIEEFVKKEGNVNSRIRKKIVGSCWLAGFSKGEIREEVVEILKKATKISGEKREWNGYYFHFSQAYSHALQEILLAKPSSHYMVSYSSQINAQIDMLKSREAIQRHIAILTLGSLTGINYFERILSTHNESYYFFSLASDTTTALVLDNLQSISIISGMNVKDVKGGRIALAVLGRIVQYASRLSDEFTSTFTTSSMEPKDYSRLPVQSYLKALFNWLTKMSKAKKLGSPMNVEAVSLIISTISKVKVGLPPVNWFPLLSRFGDPAYKRCNLHYKSILMAIQHCQQSTSLMEFLIYSLVRFPEIHKSLDNDIEFEKLLVGNAMGKILELCGFENTLFDNENGTSKKDTEINKTRGMESVLKSVTIPSSRVTEIVDCVLNSLFGETKDRETPKDIELQTIFLTTIVGHISRINSTGGSTLLQDIRKLLKEKYYVLHPPSDEEQAQIIRLFVHSCIINIEDHHTSPDLLKEAIILCTMSELGRIDPIKHLIPFLSERLINVDIMSLELSSVSNLIFSWIFRSINVHIHSSAKSEINKRRNRLEWLARILELLLILGTQRQGERVNLADDKEIFEYGMNVALCGLVNLSWDENLAKITTREKSYTCEYYEMWNKEFERIVQDKASVRKLSTLIPREALIQSRESEQIDAIVKKVRKAFSYFEVVKRLLRLLELVPTTPNYVEYRFAIRSTLTSLRPHITTQEYLDIVSSQS